MIAHMHCLYFFDLVYFLFLLSHHYILDMMTELFGISLTQRGDGIGKTLGRENVSPTVYISFNGTSIGFAKTLCVQLKLQISQFDNSNWPYLNLVQSC